MKINSSTMGYIKSEIAYACKTFKNRKAGSAAERECQMHLKSELSQWADTVAAENFLLAPDALLGWLVPAALLSVFSVFCLWLGGFRSVFFILGSVCMTAALATAVLEFGLYKKFADFAFPKAESVNIYAVRKPLGETRQRIVFGGHADAAYEMRPALNTRNNVFVCVFLAGAAGGMLCVWVFNIIAAFTGTTALFPTALCFVPFFIAMLFLINKKIIVDGANDNLSGCLAAMSVLREMHLNGMRLQNTEVCCLITGGEESGLRGAQAFAKAHKREFQDVETLFIALDTLHDTEQLRVYTRGINGLQKNCGKTAGLMALAAKDMGRILKTADLYVGAMDSEAFSREGLPACGLAGVNHVPQPYYHTRHDTCDNIGEDCIQAALEICLNAALRYDQSAAAKPQDPQRLADAV